MFNFQIVLGHLGRDPEMKYTPQGTPITTFSVAANYSYAKPGGERVKDTEWFDVQAWKKGSLVLITGRTKTNKWTGEDGQNHTRKVLVADRVVFVDLKNGVAEQAEMAEPQPAMADSEIPF
jgi:single-strand DNA-binding protein